MIAETELFGSYAFEHSGRTGPSPAHLGVAAVVAVVLVGRRRAPLSVALGMTVVLAVEAQTVGFPNTYAVIVMQLIGLFGVGAYTDRVRTALLGFMAASLLGLPIGLADDQDPLGTAITGLVFDTAVVTAGLLVRRQRRRAEQMARERDDAEQRAAEAAAEERARIARELHDVVAHGMSIVVLQARGGRRLIDDDHEAARAVLDDIDRVASDCLSEMRRLLGILRAADPQDAPLAPQPRLAELDALVCQARASGAAVELMVTGDVRELAPAVELSAYRVAQEALTNALKHAPGSTCRVRLHYDARAVVIEVVDDGPGCASPNGGHGLIGMRERVELFGGTLAVANKPDGGFAVRASFPVVAQ